MYSTWNLAAPSTPFLILNQISYDPGGEGEGRGGGGEREIAIQRGAGACRKFQMN